MRFTLSSSLLNSQLQTLSKVINSKNSLPILDCILFEVGDGQLTLTASDKENVMTIVLALDACEGAGAFALPKTTVIDAVKELPEQPLTFDVKEDTLALTITYQNGMYQFVAQNAEEFPKAKSLSDDAATLTMDVTMLADNLTRSLSKEEMKEVDVQVLKGVVYISLADNMLYKSGSYEINDRAAETLSKIAKIITDYKDYEVLIEGNTDNVPVNASAATMKNIRNNWDLSCLRASSVVQALQNKYGVDPKRLTAGGRGEYNPVTTNSTEVGKQRNRRTQIIITPKLDQFMDLIDKAPENE